MHLLTSLLAAAILSIAPAAFAERGERDLARVRYERAQALFEAGDYVAALSEFRAAYRSSPHPVVLTSQATCHERLGQHRVAEDLYQRYLRERPDAPNRAEIEGHIARIRAMPGTLQISSTPAGASVRVDGAPQPGVTPLEAEVPPGRHVVVLELAGRASVTREVLVEHAAASGVEVDLSSGAAEAPAPAGAPGGDEGPADGDPAAASPATAATDDASPGGPSTPASLLVPAWIAGGIAAVAAAAAVVTGAFALIHNDEFHDGLATGRDWGELGALADQGRTEALVADILFGTALAAGITAAVLFAIEVLRAESLDEGPFVEPMLSDGIYGASIRF